jgi:hypothetical protein
VVEEDIHKEVEAVLLATAHLVHSSLLVAAYHRDSIRLEAEDSTLVVGSSQQEEGEGTWHHNEDRMVDVDSNMVVAYHGLKNNQDRGGFLQHQEDH